MSDLEPVRRTQITGREEAFDVDVVEKDDGAHRMLVDAETSPVPLGQLFTIKPELSGSSALNVNGNIPKVFTFPTSVEDRIITSINLFGRDSGIKFGNFLGKNSEITNGIQISIKSEDQLFNFLPIKTTDDFRNVFAVSPSDFHLDIASGEDAFTASFIPSAPFFIRGSGQFGTPDFITITIQDNISSVAYLEAIVKGAVD